MDFLAAGGFAPLVDPPCVHHFGFPVVNVWCGGVLPPNTHIATGQQPQFKNEFRGEARRTLQNWSHWCSRWCGFHCRDLEAKRDNYLLDVPQLGVQFSLAPKPICELFSNWVLHLAAVFAHSSPFTIWAAALAPAVRLLLARRSAVQRTRVAPRPNRGVANQTTRHDRHCRRHCWPRCSSP